eukprot:9072805-Pyramimonas_sp.AAC.1
MVHPRGANSTPRLARVTCSEPIPRLLLGAPSTPRLATVLPRGCVLIGGSPPGLRSDWHRGGSPPGAGAGREASQPAGR